MGPFWLALAVAFAGGVALNCVANGKVLKDGQFNNVWVQPAAGDAGGALGADQKSIAIAVTLQPTQATLTDAEIEAVSDKIVANVAKQTGGVLRG